VVIQIATVSVCGLAMFPAFSIAIIEVMNRER
jgi:hypothetical protein